MKYLALLLAVGLAAGNGQMWPMGEQFTREIVLKIPCRPALPSPPCQFYLDHGPWDGYPPQIKKSKGWFPVEVLPTDEE